MADDETPKEGWWWPSNAGKAHYMRNGRSLCGRWGTMFANPRLEQGNDNSRDNCAACKRKVLKEKEGK